MQVFIVGSPLETAMALDPKRLRKQIIECGQILDALTGAKAWSNHPCVLQYRGNIHTQWLRSYCCLLKNYKNGKNTKNYELICALLKPYFHTQEYFDQMKRRLYTKDPVHYKQFAEYGESQENWYFVDGEWRKYVNGKRI
jgi:hypothetical protein